MEKEGVRFVNITLNVPDKMRKTINQSPNRDSLDYDEFKKIIKKYEKTSKDENTAKKRQEMLGKIRKNRSFL